MDQTIAWVDFWEILCNINSKLINNRILHRG